MSNSELILAYAVSLGTGLAIGLVLKWRQRREYRGWIGGCDERLFVEPLSGGAMVAVCVTGDLWGWSHYFPILHTNDVNAAMEAVRGAKRFKFIGPFGEREFVA